MNLEVKEIDHKAVSRKFGRKIKTFLLDAEAFNGSLIYCIYLKRHKQLFMLISVLMEIIHNKLSAIFM